MQSVNNTITWQDFEKLEMHVGTVVSAEPSPEAKKPAFKLLIDFGAYGMKKLVVSICRQAFA